MTKLCGLCGQPPARDGIHGAFFGGTADDVDLHHDFDRITVGHRENGTPIKVTCYEAWTTYGMRKELTIKLRPDMVAYVAELMQTMREDSGVAELDCGA